MLVTTFETAIVDVKFLSMFDWQAVVVDEGHRLKGESSKLKTALQVLWTTAHCLCRRTRASSDWPLTPASRHIRLPSLRSRACPLPSCSDSPCSTAYC